MTISVTASNGEAPPQALTVLPGLNGDGTPHTAPHVTAASYARLRSAMLAAGMGDLLPTADGWSCYRDLTAQQHMRDIGLTTIPVGQSIHGEWDHGSAVDFQDLGGFGANRHTWLEVHGGEYGWYQPGWAQQWGSLPEPWHWEYDERGDAHAGEDPGGGFLMALSDEQQQQLLNEVLNLRGWVWAGGPDVDAGAAHPATVAGRTINVDRQVTGANGFTNSVAERVIDVQATQDRFEADLAQVGSSSARGVRDLLILVAVILVLCVVIALLRGDALPYVAVGGGGALIGVLLSHLRT